MQVSKEIRKKDLSSQYLKYINNSCKEFKKASEVNQ